MADKKLSRHAARELTFKLLFAWDFDSESSAESVYTNYFDEDAETDDTVRDAFYAIAAKKAELDTLIEETAVNWKVSRMSAVTRSLLRLAVYELTETDVPAKVVINEAIELAKTYDDDAAPAFINGILNKIARALEKIGAEE